MPTGFDKGQHVHLSVALANSAVISPGNSSVSKNPVYGFALLPVRAR